MDPIFCKALLGIADAVVSADACAGATAAIRAAEIQADAAVQAGLLTILASGGAIFAGIIAYRGQVEAANIQVRSGERQEDSEQASLVGKFRSSISIVAIELTTIGVELAFSENRLLTRPLMRILVYAEEYLKNSLPIHWGTRHNGRRIMLETVGFNSSLRTVLVFARSIDHLGPIVSINPAAIGKYEEFTMGLRNSAKNSLVYVQAIIELLREDTMHNFEVSKSEGS